MLIVTRKPGESITIGDDIKITILDVKGKYVRVGVEAPRNLAVHRQETPPIDKKSSAVQENII